MIYQNHQQNWAKSQVIPPAFVFHRIYSDSTSPKTGNSSPMTRHSQDLWGHISVCHGEGGKGAVMGDEV